MNERARIHVPTSKSLTQRALIIAALTAGESSILDPLECDDSLYLSHALSLLGADIRREPGRWTVTGGGLVASGERIECGNAGTCFRFLAALSILLEGAYTLDGDLHLRQRPVADIVEALEKLGQDVDYPGQDGFPPLRFNGRRNIPSEVTLDASRTSQFLSGLLMVGPRLPEGLTVRVEGRLVSRPYLDLTIDVMKAFGVDHIDRDSNTFHVHPGHYRPVEYRVEGDWSAAAMVLAASCITGRDLGPGNVRADSAQGDRIIVDFLDELGYPRPHVFDLSDCPDLITPLAAAAVFSSHPSEIIHAAHARIKECDRIAALVDGLSRVGVRVEEREDGLKVFPADKLSGALVDSHDDHRIAMAFGLLSLRQPGIRVTNPACVGKSYPQFWEMLEVFR